MRRSARGDLMHWLNLSFSFLATSSCSHSWLPSHVVLFPAASVLCICRLLERRPPTNIHRLYQLRTSGPSADRVRKFPCIETLPRTSFGRPAKSKLGAIFVAINQIFAAWSIETFSPAFSKCRGTYRTNLLDASPGTNFKLAKDGTRNKTAVRPSQDNGAWVCVCTPILKPPFKCPIGRLWRFNRFFSV